MASIVAVVRTFLWRVRRFGKTSEVRLGDVIEERSVNSREKANGDSRVSLAESFAKTRKIQALRSLQMKGALSRLDQTIKDFGEELVITAKTNGNGRDT